MKFLVNDLSRIYGLSNQTLHYYEKKGLLRPERDVINGYRYFDITDLSVMGALKKYRNAEFSLNEVAVLSDGSNEDDIIESFENQIERLTKEIERKELIIEQLKKETILCNNYKKNGSIVTIEELEGFLRFKSTGMEIVYQNKKIRKEATPWFENIFFTNASKMFYLKDGEEGLYEYSYGMLATKSAAKFLNLKVTENVDEIEGGYFATCMINSKYETDINESINKCAGYIKDNNYFMRSQPFTRIIFYYKEKDLIRTISQIIIPVAKK